MPVGERARSRIRRQICAEPYLLSRTNCATYLWAIAVQRDDVPHAEVEAVIALASRAGSTGLNTDAIEVIEVARGTCRPVLVVAGRGIGDRLVYAPRRLIVGVEVRKAPDLVLDVAGEKHRVRRDGGNQRRRLGLFAWTDRRDASALSYAAPCAANHVSSDYDDRIARSQYGRRHHRRIGRHLIDAAGSNTRYEENADPGVRCHGNTGF